LATFEEDFVSFFPIYDYVVHMNNKHRRNPIGNAILYRKDMFTLVESHSRTKAIHAKLAVNQPASPVELASKTICISNVHLTSRLRSGEPARMKEIVSATTLWSQEEKNVILAGDFNDNFSNPDGIVETIMNAGYKIPTYTETDMSCCSVTMTFRPDHILSKGNLVLLEELIPTRSITDCPIPTLVYPSDHIPIVQNIRLT
jgi:endonuclease/exonuclease/phosphatase family metal-dependent hydrolase